MILMKKYEDSKVPITIDPVTNEYKIIVPEWVVNEFDWYEDTELVWHVDDTGIHIQEVSECTPITYTLMDNVCLRI